MKKCSNKEIFPLLKEFFWKLFSINEDVCLWINTVKDNIESRSKDESKLILNISEISANKLT